MRAGRRTRAGKTPKLPPMADETKRGDASLDKRQRQIVVGAGREDARYNVEFIDFLKRWGPTVLLVIAAASLGFMGLQRWREAREGKMGVAFGDVDQAISLPQQGLDANPEGLLAIAEENAGQGSVPLLARIAAAEQWRVSAMKGLRVGSQPDQKTRQFSKEDELTPDGRKDYLAKARAQYQMVVDLCSGNKSKATFELTGLMGLAAVAETSGDAEGAKAAYTRAQKLAEDASFPEYAALAKSRLESVDKFVAPVIIMPESMVNSWDKPVVVTPVPPAPGTSGSLLQPSALTGQFTPGAAPVAPAVPVTPEATPTPAPTNPPAPVTPAPAPTPGAPEKKDEPKKP